MVIAQDPLPRQHVAPRPVVYGRLVLSVQACIWALVVLPAATVVAMNVQSNVVHRTAAHAPLFISVSVVALLFMLGMSAAVGYLAANLKPGRVSIRRAAVAGEVFMACLGLLIAYVEAGTGAGIIAGLPVSAGLAGTMLSLAAAVGLLGKAARNYSKRGMHATV